MKELRISLQISFNENEGFIVQMKEKKIGRSNWC